MFKVLAYDADAFAWVCVSTHRNREQSRVAYFLAVQSRSHQWVALVRVRYAVADGAAEIDVIRTDAPRPEHLPNVKEFREAALLAVK